LIFLQQEKRTMKTLLSFALIALALASSALLSGCNTVQGVGKDVKAAGNGIEKAASK
jgi:predicted small secreted protein